MPAQWIIVLFSLLSDFIKSVAFDEHFEMARVEMTLQNLNCINHRIWTDSQWSRANLRFIKSPPPSLSPELGWTKETASKQVTSHNRWERGPVSLIIAFKWRQAHIIAFKYFPKTDGKYCIEIGTRPIITGKCTNLWVLHQNLSKYVVHLSPLWSYRTGRSWFWCLGPGDMICHGDLTHFLWIPLHRR